MFSATGFDGMPDDSQLGQELGALAQRGPRGCLLEATGHAGLTSHRRGVLGDVELRESGTGCGPLPGFVQTSVRSEPSAALLAGGAAG
jgi:hypothetical protein